MTRAAPLLWIVGLFVTLAVGLACAKKAPPHPMTDPIGRAEARGQVPADVLAEATATHGGSFDEDTGTAGGDAAPGTEYARTDVPKVVLGPVIAEEVPPNVDPVQGDAGAALRSAISQQLGGPGLVLLDLPEERFTSGSPRPDLARRGVRFVVKGTVRFTQQSSEASVYLQAIETQSGEIRAFASAKNAQAEVAAREAAGRLARDLRGRLGLAGGTP